MYLSGKRIVFYQVSWALGLLFLLLGSEQLLWQLGAWFALGNSHLGAIHL